MIVPRGTLPIATFCAPVVRKTQKMKIFLNPAPAAG